MYSIKSYRIEEENLTIRTREFFICQYRKNQLKCLQPQSIQTNLAFLKKNEKNKFHVLKVFEFRNLVLVNI